MTDDAKKWVTVKIPESVRTYGKVMNAGLNAPHPESDGKVNRDLVAEQVVQTLSSELGLGDDVNADELASEVAARIDYAELASKTADELEGRMR
jgi:hypothetical protein